MRKEFVEFCNGVGSRGLIKCSSGNASVRYLKGMLITSSGAWLERLTEEDVCSCFINPLSCVDVLRKPSTEAIVHASIYNVRSDVNVVLHFQSPYATALCAMNIYEDEMDVIPEIPYYIKKISFLKVFIKPGSKELVEGVSDCFKKGSNMVMLRNHGMFTVGKDFDDCLQKAEFFELGCKIILTGWNGLTLIPKGTFKST